VNCPWVEIEAVCEVHHGSGRLVVQGDGKRIVLDAHADHCCVLVLDSAAGALLFDMLGQWLG